MNDLIQLKGRFQQSSNTAKGGSSNLPKATSTNVTAGHINDIAIQLDGLNEHWKRIDTIDGALIDIHYRQVIAKSNRVRALFKNGQLSPNYSIKGARFDSDGHHIITHYVSEILITAAIKKLMLAAKIVENEFNMIITSEQLQKIEEKSIDFKSYNLSKTEFKQIIVDAYYIDYCDRPQNSADRTKDSIVTLYKVNDDIRGLLKKIDIDIPVERYNGDSTVLLFPPELMKLEQRASYLIAMTVEDINKIVLDDSDRLVQKESWATVVPKPKNEPTVGVIDTQFDENAYFNEWVDYTNLTDPIFGENKRHGTAVSSIIVDGPQINPDLEDGCGRFKVRHFGIIGNQKMSSFGIMRHIKQIIETNQDIKVWNLSLGSEREVAENFISPEGALLDELQEKFNIIFVVSGTNYLDGSRPGEKFIGSPADSINSIVVNAVDEKGIPTSYTRKGKVLSFFKKPDVAYFGGAVTGKKVTVCTPMGAGVMIGTSIAAPWVTRKVAFLVEVLGVSREVAKALIIDSASDWNDTGNNLELSNLIGHGVVPKHISSVVQSKPYEIKFFIEMVSKKYDTYTYNLPVPIEDDKHPFMAKATLCYFPKCSINQGVDYTNTELDLYIGRIKNDGRSPGIKSIDRNVQSLDDGDFHPINEEMARKFFRKWDNTKHIRESVSGKVSSRKAYGDGLWGISVKTKNRYDSDDGKDLKFGLIVTLREVNGINRIRDFIRGCELRGWLVNPIDIQSRVDIFNKAQEFIDLDF